MKSPKIVVIGAGSAVFGPTTIATIIRSARLRGSTIALVDTNNFALQRAFRVAQEMNEAWDASMTVCASTDRSEVLSGANYVIVAVEVAPREKLWRLDWEIPLRHGLRQPYAENGGPGGMLHTFRQVPPLLAIARDMEEVCPEAWLINFSNPLTRVMRALNKYSSIRTVGKCHQIEVGYGIAAILLRDEYGFDIPEDVTLHSDPDNVPTIHRSARIGREYFRIKAIGLNHFTWMVDVRDRETGDDVYPLMREALKRVPDTFEPLSMDLFRCFGYCPVPGDTHLAEFLPYTHDPIAKPWQRYQIRLYDWDGNEARRERSHDLMEQIATDAKPVADLRESTSEGAVEFIEAIEGNLNSYDEAVNVTNAGAIPNLPAEAVVELPALVNGSGVQALSFDPLPFPIAELCRREAALVEIVVDAAVCGDRDLALQALLLDPMINDIERARNILDDYLESHAQYLPQFR